MVGYTPNLIHWSVGDFVLHDADAKEPYMLMQVIGYTKDGLVRTKYVDRDRSKKVWINESIWLHDPRLWDIDFFVEYTANEQTTTIPKDVLMREQARWENKIARMNKRNAYRQRLVLSFNDIVREASSGAVQYDKSFVDRIYADIREFSQLDWNPEAMYDAIILAKAVASPLYQLIFHNEAVSPNRNTLDALRRVLEVYLSRTKNKTLLET